MLYQLCYCLSNIDFNSKKLIPVKRIILIPILLALFACQHTEEVQQTEIFSEEGKHIVLMHPTVFNLERFIFLTENNIFPLPEGYRAVGVYHESAAYDYELSHNFIRNNNIENIALLGLQPTLAPDNLFGENPLTSQFGQIFEKSEGVIFFGGPDIPPALYGKPTSLLTVITDPHRHYLELSFLFHLLGGFQDEGFTPLLEEKPDFSILGICLGMQTMNVATGGTMYQDIPTELYDTHTVEDVLAKSADNQHRNYHIHFRTDPDIEPYTFHRIRLEPGSIAETIAGNSNLTPYVYSSHHQALKKMGKGWRVTSHSMDGKIAEAIEHEKYPNVYGVQYHPEVIKLYQDEPLNFIPGQTDGSSFFEGYPGEKGKDFHLNFWSYFAGTFP